MIVLRLHWGALEVEHSFYVSVKRRAVKRMMETIRQWVELTDAQQWGELYLQIWFAASAVQKHPSRHRYWLVGVWVRGPIHLPRHPNDAKICLPVASSRTSKRGRLMMARARLSSWRSPTLKLEPPSSSLVSRTPLSSIEDAMRTSTRAARTWLSSQLPNGSRHSRTVVPARKGFCGMIDIPPGLPRTSARPNLPRSTPSSRMCPDSISTRRNSAAVRELLPVLWAA